MVCLPTQLFMNYFPIKQTDRRVRVPLVFAPSLTEGFTDGRGLVRHDRAIGCRGISFAKDHGVHSHLSIRTGFLQDAPA